MKERGQPHHARDREVMRGRDARVALHDSAHGLEAKPR